MAKNMPRWCRYYYQFFFLFSFLRAMENVPKLNFDDIITFVALKFVETWVHMQFGWNNEGIFFNTQFMLSREEQCGSVYSSSTIEPFHVRTKTKAKNKASHYANYYELITLNNKALNGVSGNFCPYIYCVYELIRIITLCTDGISYSDCVYTKRNIKFTKLCIHQETFMFYVDILFHVLYKIVW